MNVVEQIPTSPQLKKFVRLRHHRLHRLSPQLRTGSVVRPGRLRVKSLPEKDFREVIGIPGSEESLILDAEFFGLVVLQHAQSEASDHAEVRIAVTFADSAIVFAECQASCQCRLFSMPQCLRTAFAKRSPDT